MENKFFTAERALYASLYYLIITGFIANAYAGSAVYKEYTRPGSSIMVGDLSPIDTYRGKK